MKKRVMMIVGFLLLLLLGGVVGSQAEKGYKMTRAQTSGEQEQGLVARIDFLNQLLQNSYRSITEYDTSADEGAEVSLWSEERTIAETQCCLGELLSKRAEWRRQETRYQLLYQQGVRRWGIRFEKEGNLYQALLEVVQAFSCTFDKVEEGERAPFRQILKRELELALGQKWYREAEQALNYMTQSLPREPRLSALRYYLQEFPHGAERSGIDLQILELTLGQELAHTEEAMMQSEAEWARLQPEWETKLGALRTEVKRVKQEMTRWSTRAKRSSEAQLEDLELRLSRLMENRVARLREVTRDVEGLQASFTLYALLRSEGTELWREVQGHPRKMLKRYASSGAIREEWSEVYPAVGYYQYTLRSGEGASRVTAGMIRMEQIRCRAYSLDEGATLLQVVSQADGTPVEGVTFVLRNTSGKLLERCLSGQDGAKLFKPRSESYFVALEDHRLLERQRYYIPALPKDEPQAEVQPRKVDHFFTDRPLYRRGQEVRFGLIATEEQGGKIMELQGAERKVALVGVYSGGDKEVDSLTLVSDEKGRAEGGTRIPDDPDLERAYLKSAFGTSYLTIEDYKRQYLRVQMDSVPSGYVYGKPLVVCGRVTDLNDLPTEAEVVLTYDGGERKMKVRTHHDGSFVIQTPPVWTSEEAVHNTREWWREELELEAMDHLGHVARESWGMEKLETDFPLNAWSAIQKEAVHKAHVTLSTTTQPYHYRHLGSLEGRKVTATLTAVATGEVHMLGELPIQGEQTFELATLPSGEYTLTLSSTDGYGREVQDTTSPIYFYAPSDTHFYGSRLLWAEHLPDGSTLVASPKGGVASFFLSEEGVSEAGYQMRYIALEPRRIYRLEGLLPRERSSVRITLVHQMEEAEETLWVGNPEEVADEKGISVEGLAELATESFLPGAHFSKSLVLKDATGKPLRNQAVLVTIFDQVLVEATGGQPFWYEVIGASLPGILYENAMQLLATASPRADSAASEALRKEAAPSESDYASVALRSDFRETAFFSALLTTDKRGRVQIDFDLPDTETSYQMLLYTYRPHFEADLLAEGSFRVFSPLSIDLSHPRFLLWGDRFEGRMQIRNSGKADLVADYQLRLPEGKILAEGGVEVQAGTTVWVPFEVTAEVTAGQRQGEELTLEARVLSGDMKSGIVRRIPLLSDLSTYMVATPISAYQPTSLDVLLPKLEQVSGTPLLQLYLDPLMLLLSPLAQAYEGTKESLWENPFQLLYKYRIYAQLHTYLARHPEVAQLLKERAKLLDSLPEGEAEAQDLRHATPKELPHFFHFITAEDSVREMLDKWEKDILGLRAPAGGFRYNQEMPTGSPFLTSHLLGMLSTVQEVIRDETLRSLFPKALDYLHQELENPESYYRDFIHYARLVKAYHRELPAFTPEAQRAYEEQVAWYRTHYPELYTSALLNYAYYLMDYGPKEEQRVLEQFIQDRSAYTYNDEELLNLRLFLHREGALPDDAIGYMLRIRQGALWTRTLVAEVAERLLHQLEVTTLEAGATLRIPQLAVSHQLTTEERAKAMVQLPLDQLGKGKRTLEHLEVKLEGIQSDYIYGGISYAVTEPSREATPTGEKLKVTKQIYRRSTLPDGTTDFTLLTPEEPAQRGDELVIRYILEAEQDLSLLLLRDPRVAGAEFGYDFAGYRFSDRLWWLYSRRDTEDRIFIDYLPRGRHVLELSAVATISGYYGYGPATIESYYAPEFRGNSAGGALEIRD